MCEIDLVVAFDQLQINEAGSVPMAAAAWDARKNPWSAPGIIPGP
jgi:hypothetical protein